MMNMSCDECYLVRQRQISDCPECGKRTFSTQVINGCATAECTECGYGFASVGGCVCSCFMDENKYTVTINKPIETKKLVKVARLLSMNSIDIYKLFENDFATVSNQPYKWRFIFDELRIIDVNFELGDEFKNKYPRIINCPYEKGMEKV